MKVAILASGKGSNFEALVKAVKKQKIKVKVKLLICDKEKAFVRKRAKKLKIPQKFVNPNDFKSRALFDKELVKILHKERIELILLAGYMRILLPHFVKNFKNKIINIHPSLLPAFRGTRSIERAYKRGCKKTGVTVHFVDEKVDHGQIILQESLEIKKGESLKRLEERIHKLEHKLYPKALKLILER